MRQQWTTQFNGLVLVAVALMAPLLGGCTSTATLKRMPAEEAWSQLQSDSENSVWLLRILGFNKFEDLVESTNKQAKESYLGSGLPVEAFNQMTDEMAQYLATELPKAVQDRPFRAYLAVGKIADLSVEKNPYIATSLDSVAISLKANQAFSNSFRIVDRTKKEAEDLMKVYSGGDLSDFQGPDVRSGSLSASIDPRDIYVLSGTYAQMQNNTNHTINCRLITKTSDVAKNDVVVGREFRRSYIFHPGFKDFITSERNESIRREWEASKSAPK